MSATAAHPTGGVLVLGHRGSQATLRPENTVAAVTAALASGADGIEIDVRLSADGVLVCSHEPRVGVAAGRAMTVATKAAAELLRLALPGGHRLATLEEVLTAAAAHAGARVVVEAKPVADPSTALRTVRALRRTLARFTGLDVTVSSFDADLLRAIRGACAGLVARTALLGQPDSPVHALLLTAAGDGHEEVHAPLVALRRDPDAVEAAHRLGLAVTCWTVNARRDLEWLAALGVDGVITDDVVTARAALAGLRSRAVVQAGPAAC